MDEGKIAYIMLTLGVILSFSLFVFSVVLSELGYGGWLIMAGVMALSLTPVSTVLALLLNYILKKDYKWSLLSAAILLVVLLSAITTYLLR